MRSRLAAPAADVWAVATTAEGINEELRPLLRMTHPRGGRLDLRDLQPPVRLGRSWLLLGGVLPIDYDDIVIDDAGDGWFRERSSMLSMVRWHHDRDVVAISADTCEVSDRLTFRPRVPGTGPLLRAVVGMIFAHRHRRLRRRFGAA